MQSICKLSTRAPAPIHHALLYSGHLRRPVYSRHPVWGTGIPIYRGTRACPCHVRAKKMTCTLCYYVTQPAVQTYAILAHDHHTYTWDISIQKIGVSMDTTTGDTEIKN